MTNPASVVATGKRERRYKACVPVPISGLLLPDFWSRSDYISSGETTWPKHVVAALVSRHKPRLRFRPQPCRSLFEPCRIAIASRVGIGIQSSASSSSPTSIRSLSAVGLVNPLSAFPTRGSRKQHQHTATISDATQHQLPGILVAPASQPSSPAIFPAIRTSLKAAGTCHVNAALGARTCRGWCDARGGGDDRLRISPLLTCAFPH
jgi:hypothetical protein